MLGRRELLRATGVAGLGMVVGGCREEPNGDARPTSGTPASGTPGGTPSGGPGATGFRMPAEGGPHEVTWMAYGATPGVWGEDSVSPYGRDLRNSRIVARQDLVRLAATIARFEPVVLLVNSAADEAEARRFLAECTAGRSVKDQVGDELDRSGRIYAGGEKLPAIGSVEFVRMPLNDLWARDTAPVFVRDAGGRLHGVDLNFNGWGQWPPRTGLPGWRKDPVKTRNGIRDQPVTRDRGVAAGIAVQGDVQVVRTWLTMEGGGLEVNGAGLGVATESCILNPNRNPGRTKAQVEAELRRVFGVERMLWMPGRPGIELTDWHVDFLARFVAPGNLLYAASDDPEDEPDQRALRAGVDRINTLPANERALLLGGADRLTLHAVQPPDPEQVFAAYQARNRALPITERGADEFAETAATGYVGYYEANGCVVLGQFGDLDADQAAYDLLSELYPDRIVVQITTDGLANAGGTIHCATQQQPA
ncbi:agmatine deiminase family protein [Kribbella italica]|uniref:Agmatine deiminase n=1 Tax=Kribbella italica TaxID=1540520 RepID=A0A7W9MRY5_9ACTN|nr:agmatine deiminase family protein [Kribbella italica]MBB5834029.1 agmatine deiminase [Kribbella italica]